MLVGEIIISIKVRREIQNHDDKIIDLKFWNVHHIFIDYRYMITSPRALKVYFPWVDTIW